MNKNLFNLLLFALVLTFSACSGSETYRGKWLVVDADGNNQELFFTEDRMTLKKSETDSTVWTYTQNSVSIENASSKYGIKLDNGASFTVFFPTGDKTKGAIADANDNIIYIIGRTKHYSYQDVFGLN